MARLSVVVPARNAGADLSACIDALHASDLPRAEWDLIVVEDSAALGPAFARNSGAHQTELELIAFVDADVIVHPDALSRMLRAFDDEAVGAVFGSYDDHPADQSLVSQYRNLLHHFVHQQSPGFVESFWAGCGAVRRHAFHEAGEFDSVRYSRPSIEDVELGYRIRDRHWKIVLDPEILCTHRKRWTLRRMIASDFANRGVPWTQLLLRREAMHAPRGLSLGLSQLAGVALTAIILSLVALEIAAPHRSFVTALAIAAIAFAIVNAKLVRFFFRKRGFAFATLCLGLHFMYNVVSLASLLYGGATYFQPTARPIPSSESTRCSS